MSAALSLDLNGTRIAFRARYGALVAAEAEIGSLFALVERTGSGGLTLTDMLALLWHCRVPGDEKLTREAFADQCVEAGIAQLTPLFRQLMEQALGGA